MSDSTTANLESLLQTLREMKKTAFQPPAALQPEQPPMDPAMMQGGGGQPPMDPAMAGAPAGPDPMMEVMGAMEQLAGMLDQVTAQSQSLEARNQQLEGRLANFEKTIGEVEGKYSLLMDILKQPGAPM